MIEMGFDVCLQQHTDLLLPDAYYLFSIGPFIWFLWTMLVFGEQRSIFIDMYMYSFQVSADSVFNNGREAYMFFYVHEAFNSETLDSQLVGHSIC